MPRTSLILAVLFLLLVGQVSQGGLYYSGEHIAELPSQWRGFLLDQRLLRTISMKPAGKTLANPARSRYQEAVEKLAKVGQSRKLSADELADLGALSIRLGDVSRALEVLRAAERQYPDHFRIAANLGTAWQLQGNLDQAMVALRQAVRLAPGNLEKAEVYQLKLVLLRQKQPRDASGLDDLFGVRYLGASGSFAAGSMAAAEAKKLPSDAAAILQQLGLWLPADGRLLWQMAELANAHGDVQTAAAIMDGCVSEFGMSAPELRQHRQAVRACQATAPLATSTLKAAHQGHAGGITPRSKRPLLSRLDQAPLPPIQENGVTPLPWSVMAETSLNRMFQPTFPKYLNELNGKQINLAGYMQPLGEGADLGSFMLIEYPVGCWYCEKPDISSILIVELPEGQTTAYTRGPVRVTGKLYLNATDPEKFLYAIMQAKVTEGD